jgi:hypothetical protein
VVQLENTADSNNNWTSEANLCTKVSCLIYVQEIQFPKRQLGLLCVSVSSLSVTPVGAKKFLGEVDFFSVNWIHETSWVGKSDELLTADKHSTM